MKKALGLYAAGLYAFLHLPLLILGAFSFNASRAQLSIGEEGGLAAQWINLFL